MASAFVFTAATLAFAILFSSVNDVQSFSNTFVPRKNVSNIISFGGRRGLGNSKGSREFDGAIGHPRRINKLSMGLTLYGSPGSRSPLVNWAGYELNLPLTMGDLSENPHPFEQIPCLTDYEDGDVVVFESGAILNYLYSKSESFKKDSPSRRAAIMSWIVWANASLDPICFIETPEGKVYDTGLKKPNRRIDTLDAFLSQQEFLLEDGFSVADVAVAAYLLYVPQFFQGVNLSRWPNVVRYMKTCAARPAYGEAYSTRLQEYLVEILGAMEEGDGSKKLFGMF